MKRLLPLFFASLLILSSIPVIAYAGEGAIGSIINNSAIENFLNRDKTEPETQETTEPDAEVPDFGLNNLISQFMTQGSKTEAAAPDDTVPEEDAAAAEEAAIPEEAAPEDAVPEEAPAEGMTPEEAAAAAEEAAKAAEEAAKAEALAEKAAEVLAYLDNETYTDTMTSLMDGSVINYGDYSYDAAGLQQILVDLGCPISVDGNAGPGTFTALNTILTSLGIEETYTADAEIYWQLLALQLMNTDTEAADEILPKYYESGENSSQYQYVKATLFFTQEKYYRAMEAFEESQYGDWEEKAALCPQAWPADGELWHNSNYYSQQMSLSFEVNSYDEAEGKCFEVYTADGDLASVLFLTGSGTVKTWLPGGAYKIKNAAGTEWYGFTDAFGRYGYYEFMEFDEDESDPYLTWLYSGYEWTITINVTQTDPDTANVGSVYSDWESWTDQ